MDRLKVLWVYCLLMLCGCGASQTGGAVSNGVNPSVVIMPTNIQSKLVIDPMAVVPVIGGVSTTGKIYLHNYSPVPVTNLTFKVVSNVPLSQNLDKDMILQNTTSCESLASGGSCSVTFSTPSLAIGGQGSNLVIVNYTIGENNLQTSIIVDYEYVSPSTTNSINFSSGLTVNGVQNTTHYVVGYLYAVGDNSIFDNVQLLSSRSGVQINNGFINTQNMVANQVIPVEFELLFTHNIKDYVTITPIWGSSQIRPAADSTINYGDPLYMVLDQTPNKIDLAIGKLPIIYLSEGNQVGLNIVNKGNIDATSPITAMSDDERLSIDDSDCSNKFLGAYATNSCFISFLINGITSGSTTVYFKQNGRIVESQALHWINNSEPVVMPNLLIKANQNSLSLNKGTITTQSSIKFILTNLGDVDLSIAAYQIKNSDSFATWVQDSRTCSAIIQAHSQCLITGHLIGVNSTSDGALSIQVQAQVDSKIYNFVSSDITYTVVAAPLLEVLPMNVNMTIVANDSDMVNQIMTVTNQGNEDAIINHINLVNNSGVSSKDIPIITSSTCNIGGILEAHESCIVDVTYRKINGITTSVSGNAYLQVEYSNSNADQRYNVQNSINYQLLSNDGSSVIVSDISPVGLIESNDIYIGDSAIDKMALDLTYTNNSVNYAMENFNLNIASLPSSVVVDPSSTCPTGGVHKTILIDESCSLRLKLDKSILASLGSNGSIVLNFRTPIASWSNQTGGYTQQGRDVRINYFQLTLLSTLSVNQGYFKSTTLNLNAVNINEEQTPLSVNISGVAGALNNPPSNLSNNCKLNDSDFSIVCEFSQTVKNANVTYNMNNYATSHTNMSIPISFRSTAEQYLGFMPQTQTIYLNVPKVDPYPYPTPNDYPKMPNGFDQAIPSFLEIYNNRLSPQIAYGYNSIPQAEDLAAIIFTGGTSFCSGTPIESDGNGGTWLVSAAHCFVKSKSSSTEVKNGEISTNIFVEKGITSLRIIDYFPGVTIYVPKNYCSGSVYTSKCSRFFPGINPTQGNDIALIHISKPFNTDPNSYPRIAESFEYPVPYTMAPVLSMGYGLSSSSPYVYGTLYYAVNYIYGKFDAVGYHYLYNAAFNPDPNKFGYNTAFCSGDSGGPDLYWNGSQWLLLSEHTFGIINSCANFYNYISGGATNVSHYYEWIRSIIDSSDPANSCKSGAIPNCSTSAP